MACSISLMQMYSSAEWEREDCPGPSFSEGQGIRAWSERVGEPKGFMPSQRPMLLSAMTWGGIFVGLACRNCKGTSTTKVPG